ncbi:MAG: DUF4388 domain-containing protein [bacterium]
MQPSRFVVLTGHLKDYPLGDLVGILRHQQKTGRLLIEYPKGPASLYFKDGELVDAQLDNLSGLQAICVAVAQPASAFNFNPLIQPPRRSIENSLQRVVSELLGSWDENGLEIEASASRRSAARPAFASPSTPPPALLAASTSTINESPITTTEQALVFSSVALEVPKTKYSRPVLAMAAAGLMMLGLSTVIAVSGGFSRKAAPVAAAPAVPVNEVGSGGQNAATRSVLPTTETRSDLRSQHNGSRGSDNANLSEQSSHPVARSSTKQTETESAARSVKDTTAAKPQTETEKTRDVSAKIQSVKVNLQIENGRVAQASVANHKPGMEAYEALALRIARQRRYPTKAAGPEAVMIKVTQPN